MKHELVITDIRLKIKAGGNMKAICTIIVNDLLAINDIRVIENRDRQLLVAMPSKKMHNGSFKDMANPVNPEARRIIEEAVLGEYNKQIALNEDLFELIG